MLLTAEVTLYPLQDDYLPVIKAFLARLGEMPDIQVRTFPTATLVSGDFDRVYGTLGEMIRWSQETLGKSIFVVKFLPDHGAS